MIKRNRLEQLIEQGATIYFVYNGRVDEKEGIYKDDFILNETYVSIYWTTRSHQIKYENLFETQAEAEEYLEFGNVTRTDTLKIPFWKDVLDNCKTLEEQKRYTKIICEFDDVELKIYKDNGLWYISIWNYDYDALLSRENYNEARRLCVKLFRGE